MLGADTRTCWADLTGWSLEFGVVTFADSTPTVTTAITDLPILGKTGGDIHGTVASAAGVVGITDALPAFTASMS